MPTPTDARPWARWYGLQRWRRRAAMQMKMHPLCSACLQKNIVIAASVADHVIPHKGDPMKFWYGELQSLCGGCHSSSKQQIEIKGFVGDIGPDGFPIDRKHPFNKHE